MSGFWIVRNNEILTLAIIITIIILFPSNVNTQSGYFYIMRISHAVPLIFILPPS